MKFNPFSDRKNNQMFDETDEIGWTIVFAFLILLAALLASKVLSNNSELNYLQQNNCAVEEYNVRATNGTKKTLWVCNKGRHYISNQL